MEDQVLKWGVLLQVTRECGRHLQKQTNGVGVLSSHVSGGFPAGSGVKQPGRGACLDPHWLHDTVSKGFHLSLPHSLTSPLSLPLLVIKI